MVMLGKMAVMAFQEQAALYKLPQTELLLLAEHPLQ
jgi:hypothetical protein